MAKIITLKDDLTNEVAYPQTKASAVYLDNGDTVQEDLTELGQRELNKYLYDRDNILPYWEGGWTQGGISGTTGAEESSSTRIRSGYIPVINGVLHVQFYASNLSLRIYQFDENNTIITAPGFIGSDASITLDVKCKYVRFVLRKPNDTGLTPAIISNLAIAVFNRTTLDFDNYISRYAIATQIVNKNLGAIGFSIQSGLPTSDLISIKPNSWYFLHVDSAYLVKYILLDENKVQISESSFLVSGTFVTSSTARFAKLVVGLPEDSLVVLRVSDLPTIVFQSFEYANLAQLTYENKDADGVSNTARLTSKEYLAIPHNTTFKISVKSGYTANVLLYDTIGGERTSTGYAQSQEFNTGSKSYIRVLMRKTNDTIIRPTDDFNVFISLVSYFNGANKLLRLKVGQWNCGHFNYGGNTSGMPDADVPTELPTLKDVITRECADIFVLNEWFLYLNQGDSGATRMSTYDTILKQFYPYKYEGGGMAIYSKFPIAITQGTTTASGRSYLVGSANIEGIEIGLLCVHLSPYSLAERTDECEELAPLMADYALAIAPGDYNTSHQTDEETLSQLEPFTEDNFVMGNFGYWGKIATTINQNPADNILAKGFNIDNYVVLSENSVSDHYPTFAIISALV